MAEGATDEWATLWDAGLDGPKSWVSTKAGDATVPAIHGPLRHRGGI
jgi:hypothetical protein